MGNCVTKVKQEDEDADVEEVQDGADLVLGHVGGKHKWSETELGQEVLDAVGLDHVVHHYHGFAFDDGKLDQDEH